jgi:hypothetical protein
MKVPSISKKVLVVRNTENVRQLFKLMNTLYTLNYLTMEEPLAQGYIPIKKKQRKLLRYSMASVPSPVELRGMELLYVDYMGNIEELEAICDELDSLCQWWDLWHVDKEIYATNYKNTDDMDFESRKQITKIVQGVYKQAVNSVQTSGGILYHILTTTGIKPTKKNPLIFELDASICTRFNGGEFSIDAYHNSYSVIHDTPLANYVEAMIDTSGAMCGTLMPYILPSMLICILGEELKFNDKDPQPGIDGILSGKIRFTIANDKEMGDYLQGEIHRWLMNFDYMNFALFVKHASMFMFPLKEDDTSN